LREFRDINGDRFHAIFSTIKDKFIRRYIKFQEDCYLQSYYEYREQLKQHPDPKVRFASKLLFNLQKLAVMRRTEKREEDFILHQVKDRFTFSVPKPLIQK